MGRGRTKVKAVCSTDNEVDDYEHKSDVEDQGNDDRDHEEGRVVDYYCWIIVVKQWH